MIVKILTKPLKYLAFVVFVAIVLLFFYLRFRYQSYSFFIEFDNSNGVVRGTNIRMRGINIGSIQNTKLKTDCVVALAKVNSNKVSIPINSIIETTQTGLLNEPIIDIIPVQSFKYQLNKPYLNPVSKICDSSCIVCKNSYVKGNRGLNYDDLVRSTTRISQRFDDPCFFNLLNVFLQNGIDVTDVLSEFCSILLDFVSASYIYFVYILYNYAFE